MRTSQGTQRAFTLIELLVTLVLVAILAALLFPVVASVRRSAQKSSCFSKLRQVGISTALYAQDYDDRFPFAVNPSDRAHPTRWRDYPEFEAAIPSLPQFHEVVQPYLASRQVLRCPSDTGIGLEPYPGWELMASPSSYVVFGTSYFYRTELAVKHSGSSTLQFPSGTIMLFDGSGIWHGSMPDPLYDTLQLRYNALFSDGHVKNIHHHELARLDSRPL